MSISAAEAQRITREFTATYPRATDLAFKFRSTTHGLYQSRAGEVSPTMQGGYVSTPLVHQGRTYLGRVDVVLNNAKDAQDLRETLRHEIIGHFGLNTFAPADKRALLDTLVASRDEPSLKPHWQIVERTYPGVSDRHKAEEVFCRRAEAVTPEQHLNQPGIAAAGQRAFDATVHAGGRPMTAQDLDRIVRMVAQGLHDRSRHQQTFPQNRAERLAAPAESQQAVLRAEALMIAERLARLDGPSAASPFRHPELTRQYQHEQQRPQRGQAPDRNRGR